LRLSPELGMMGGSSAGCFCFASPKESDDGL
jgi:hypothetical protein